MKKVTSAMPDPRPLAPAVERRVRESFARQQAMATIGAAMADVREGMAEIVLPFSPALTQQHGFIHAGIVALICDTACGYAALDDA